MSTNIAKGGKKLKIKYVCSTCGSESLKWLGKCPGCDQWNTYVEEIIDNISKPNFVGLQENQPLLISSINDETFNRIPTNINELDRVLGGGIVPGSFVLIGGQPGIGKSTLLLQVSNKIAVTGKKVLYVTGEESASQIKSRAVRLGSNADGLFILAEVNLDNIIEHIKKLNPDVVVIDSVQIIYRPEIPSSPGTVVQVRECSNTLMMFAKQNNISIFVVGHVTKEGNIAGPKVLEHIVDTVLYFEGDRHHSFRILRAVKNRFGSTNEIAIFEMRQDGLSEVENPSEVFLSEDTKDIPGVVVVPSLEGTRPILIELQSLISASHNVGMPRRVSTFIDSNRVALLIAIFEKVVGVGLGAHDVFINLVGGIKISEPALDLGVICAMASSFRNIPIDNKTVVLGEVGLGGEVRAVSHIDQRVTEASRLGFTRCILPQKNLKNLSKKEEKMDLVGVSSIVDALEAVF
ncbi:DNA repair protein RadA [bacterium]|nr:DNA repair protein RadA [bacterium]